MCVVYCTCTVVLCCVVLCCVVSSSVCAHAQMCMCVHVCKKKKKTFSMKHAANNTTECECMKSPIPTLSCRSLQHKCFVHVAKYDSFLCVSMIQKNK